MQEAPQQLQQQKHSQRHPRAPLLQLPSFLVSSPTDFLPGFDVFIEPLHSTLWILFLAFCLVFASGAVLPSKGFQEVLIDFSQV